MMLLAGYLLGFAVCAVVAVVVGERAARATRPTRAVRLMFAVLAAVLWPVVVLGVVQGALIAGLMKRRAASRSRRPEMPHTAGWQDDSSELDALLVPWSPGLGCRRLVDYGPVPLEVGAGSRRR